MNEPDHTAKIRAAIQAMKNHDGPWITVTRADLNDLKKIQAALDKTRETPDPALEAKR